MKVHFNHSDLGLSLKTIIIITVLFFTSSCEEELNDIFEDEEEDSVQVSSAVPTLIQITPTQPYELERLERGEIQKPVCSQFIEETVTHSDGSQSIAKRFGAFSDPEIFIVDNRGDKVRLEGVGYQSSGQNRTVFGNHNLLVECRHSYYGLFRLFVPRIGGIDNGLGSTYYAPAWLSMSGRFEAGDRQFSGALWVSPISELIYNLYTQQINQRFAVNELVSDAVSAQILEEAKRMVSLLITPSRSEDHDYYIDWEYVFANKTIINGQGGYFGNAERLSIANSPIKEQFRAIVEKEIGFDSNIPDLIKVLADLILGKQPNNRIEKTIAASFKHDSFLLGSSSLVNNPQFDGLDGWSELQNTSASADGYSNLTLFEGTLRNTVVLNLVSNILKDDGSIAHVLSQQIDVKEMNLDELYIRSSYSKLEGLLETGELPGLEDAAGNAVLFLEYLDENEVLLGTSAFANTKDPLFAGSPLAQTPVALGQFESGHLVYRLPSVANRGFVENIGQNASKAIGSERENISYIRLYAGVGHYIGGDNLRHWLGFVLVKAGCSRCEATLELHELDIVKF